MSAFEPMIPPVTRREVLRGVAAGALILHFQFGAQARNSAPVPLHSWFQLNADGRVSIFVNKTDIGQGSQSGIAQIMAEELGVEWEQVSVLQAPIEKTYFNGDTYGTAGSGAISDQWDQLRRIAATARSMLIAEAAARWKVPVEECRGRAGRVQHVPSGRNYPYGDLAGGAGARTAPKDPPLKMRSEWMLIGKSLPRLDIPAKVDGSAKYAIDLVLPGMRVAAIAQCPIFEGHLISMNETAASAMPGVHRVIRLRAWRARDYSNMPLQETVAVVADSYWEAAQGLKALAPQWQAGSEPFSTDAMWKSFRSDLDSTTINTPGRTELTLVREQDDETTQRQRIAKAFAECSRTLEAEYELPMVAHATMEPQTAVAWWKGQTVEIWSGTQAQSLLKEMGARMLGIPETSITIRTTLAGGGFGRRWYPDACLQTALIAREVDVPVKVIWSRSEDLQHDLYRPPAVARFSAAISRQGGVSGVRMRQARFANFRADGRYRKLAYEWPAFLGYFSLRPPRISWGAWRGVEDGPQKFFIECFVDELAHTLGRDPIEYRKSLLSKQPRALRLLETLHTESGWGTPMPAGHGRGVAFSFGNDSIVGQVAEVVVHAKAVKVERVTCVLDCGTVVNPDSVIAQGEGSILFGLSAALFEKIEFKDGRVCADNFNDYRLARLTDCPRIEVLLLESPDAAVGGVGEPMTAPIAPAIVNAVFAATGIRVRKLPLSTAGFSAGLSDSLGKR
jgi:isoquinoline 1-oxidoreductase beta subunit